MKRTNFLLAACLAMALGNAAQAQPMPVRHVQRPMHEFMVARSETGAVLARTEFSQVVQGDEVTLRLTYRFVDGSIDDETTTFRQKGPFFAKPVDFAVEAANGTATTRTTDKNGKIDDESEHMDLPDDLANGFIGTLLLNVPRNAKAFRVGLLAPVGSGRLVRLLISPDSVQPFQWNGQTLGAMVFRIHPDLGGIVGVIARLLGLQPKDVMVWVLDSEEPAIVRIVGQLGGYGPVVSSEVEGASFGK